MVCNYTQIKTALRLVLGKICDADSIAQNLSLILKSIFRMGEKIL